MKYMANVALALAATLGTIFAAEIGLRIYDRFVALTADDCYQASPIAELPYIAKANFRKRGYFTNSHHLRNAEIPLDKPAGALRIAVVGNSMTIGHYVEQDCLFTQIMERDLKASFQGNPGVDVINAGQQGYNIEHFMPFSRQFVYAYQPDYLIYQFCWNDVEAPLMVRSRKLPDEVPDRSLSQFLTKYSRLFGKIVMLQNLSKFAEKMLICYDDSLAWKSFVTDLSAWADDVRGRNIHFAMAIFPTALEIQIPDRYPDLTEDFRRQRNRILEQCRHYGIPTCDLTDPLTSDYQRNRKDLYLDFTHFNPRGHALAAQIIEGWLASEYKDQGWPSNPKALR